MDFRYIGIPKNNHLYGESRGEGVVIGVENEDLVDVRATNRKYIKRVLIGSLVLLIGTPYDFVYRITSIETRSLLLWVRYNEPMGLRITLPMSTQLFLFFWMRWVEIVFIVIVVLYYQEKMSYETAWKTGLASFGPGLLTFFMNGFAILNGTVILLIPIPLVALLGLYTIKMHPRVQGIWMDENDE